MKKIIIAMKDQITVLAITKALMKLKLADVMLVENHDEAIDELGSKNVDLIIVEAGGMCSFPGEEVATIAKDVHNIKSICITTDMEDVKEWKCFDQCFEKPFEMDELTNAVKNLLPK